MKESEFKSKMLYAESMLSFGERDDYWKGYIHGLNRRFHGEDCEPESEKKKWEDAIFSYDDAEAERGYGYRDGLTEVAVTHVTCLRCTWSWYPRIHTERPRICAKCKSPYWDRKKRVPIRSVESRKPKNKPEA